MNARTKTDDQNSLPEKVDVIVLTDEARPNLGLIEVSVAAQALLRALNLQSKFFLGWHVMDQGCAIDLLVQSINSATLEDCNPVVTQYETQLGPVVVVTEACNDGVNSVRTRLSLPLEQ